MKRILFLIMLIFVVGCKAEIEIEPTIECVDRPTSDEPEYHFEIFENKVFLNYSGIIAGCAPIEIDYSRKGDLVNVYERNAAKLQCRSPSRYCYRIIEIDEENVRKVELYSSNTKTLFGYKYTSLAGIVTNVPSKEPECTTDTDCVAATCCHATECVPKSQAPDCTGIMCTMSCEPGTLDCGGSCSCEEGKCTANIAEN